MGRKDVTKIIDVSYSADWTSLISRLLQSIEFNWFLNHQRRGIGYRMTVAFGENARAVEALLENNFNTPN